MAQWGRRDVDNLTGNVTIASGNTTLHGLTGATFLTELEVGVMITAGSPAQQMKVVSSNQANTPEITPAANAAITNLAAVLDDKPLYLDRATALDTINVSVADAQDSGNRDLGLKTPGGVHYKTWSANGTTRHQAEVLVAMKDPN